MKGLVGARHPREAMFTTDFPNPRETLYPFVSLASFVVRLLISCATLPAQAMELQSFTAKGTKDAK